MVEEEEEEEEAEEMEDDEEEDMRIPGMPSKPCPGCDERFTTREGFLDHIATHSSRARTFFLFSFIFPFSSIYAGWTISGGSRIRF